MAWKSAFVVALSIGSLLILELGLRVLTDRSSRWNVRLGAHKQYDPVVYMRNKPNSSFGAGSTTNEFGYWAPRNLSFEQPRDALRILYLGDSNSVLPLGRNFPVQVEELLEAQTGIDVQTVNSAVPGYSSENARLLFENELSRFEASYLIVYLGWNDLGQFGPEGLPYKKAVAGYELSSTQRLISNLYSLRFLYALGRSIRRYQPAVHEPMSAEDQRLYDNYWPHHFEENLRRILELASERYPGVYVMTLATLTSEDPSPDELARAHFPVGMDKNMTKLHQLVQTYNRAIVRVAAQTGVSVLDLYSLFDSREARKHFTDSCHLDDQGARRIAVVVAEEIRNHSSIASQGASVEH